MSLGARLARSIVLATIAAFMLMTSCAEQRHSDMLVQGHPPRPWVYDGPYPHGSKEWYDDADLDRVVREYARSHRIAFEFSGTECSFWVPRERDCMVEGSYGKRIGQPILLVKIGWDGYVTEHRVGVAICEIGSDLPTAAPSGE